MSFLTTENKYWPGMRCGDALYLEAAQLEVASRDLQGCQAPLVASQVPSTGLAQSELTRTITECLTQTLRGQGTQHSESSVYPYL